MSTMDALPNEMFIFKHLGIKDLIHCRLVCKRFMLMCDEVDIPEVIVSNYIKHKKDFWFYTNKQFNYKDAVNVRTFVAYKSKFRLEKFLKRLHFIGSCADFDLLDLNVFTQLEQLKIDLDTPVNDEIKIIDIQLPNLKILDLGDFSF